MGVHELMLQKLHTYGLWRLTAWGEGGLAVLDGATFFVRGNAVAQGPSYYILRHIPFGLHTYGAIMLILAAYIFYSSAHRGAIAQKVQFCTFIVAVWISVAVIVSWSEAGHVTFGAVTKWFFVAWVALSLYITEDKDRRIPQAEEE